jgi:hypothetical protein
MSPTDNGFKSSALRPNPTSHTGHRIIYEHAVSRTRLRAFTQIEKLSVPTFQLPADSFPLPNIFPPTTNAKDDMFPGDGFGTF